MVGLGSWGLGIGASLDDWANYRYGSWAARDVWDTVYCLIGMRWVSCLRLSLEVLEGLGTAL